MLFLDLILSDVWRPAPSLSSNGHRYFVVDHFSKYVWFYPLIQKFDVFYVFSKFVYMVERQYGTTLKSIQTN